MKKTGIPKHCKPVDILSATVWLGPDLLKGLTNLSDKTVRRSSVDWEDLKPYWKSDEWLHFLRQSISLLFKSYYLQDFP